MGNKKVFTFNVSKGEKSFLPYAIVALSWEDAQVKLLEHLKNYDFTGFTRGKEYNYLE